MRSSFLRIKCSIFFVLLPTLLVIGTSSPAFSEALPRSTPSTSLHNLGTSTLNGGSRRYHVTGSTTNTMVRSPDLGANTGKTINGDVFKRDFENAKLGETWQDPSGVKWGDLAKNSDDSFQKLTYKQAVDYCSGIGASLPNKSDVERLNYFMVKVKPYIRIEDANQALADEKDAEKNRSNGGFEYISGNFLPTYFPQILPNLPGQRGPEWNEIWVSPPNISASQAGPQDKTKLGYVRCVVHPQSLKPYFPPRFTTSGILFKQDLSNPALGEHAFRDPRGVIWGEPAIDQAGKVIYMGHQQAIDYCQKLGATLPSSLDAQWLKTYFIQAASRGKPVPQIINNIGGYSFWNSNASELDDHFADLKENTWNINGLWRAVNNPEENIYDPAGPAVICVVNSEPLPVVRPQDIPNVNHNFGSECTPKDNLLVLNSLQTTIQSLEKKVPWANGWDPTSKAIKDAVEIAFGRTPLAFSKCLSDTGIFDFQNVKIKPDGTVTALAERAKSVQPNELRQWGIDPNKFGQGWRLPTGEVIGGIAKNRDGSIRYMNFKDARRYCYQLAPRFRNAFNGGTEEPVISSDYVELPAPRNLKENIGVGPLSFLNQVDSTGKPITYWAYADNYGDVKPFVYSFDQNELSYDYHSESELHAVRCIFEVPLIRDVSIANFFQSQFGSKTQ